MSDDTTARGVLLPPRIDSPPGLAFSDLELSRDPEGRARMRQDVFDHVCRHHGVDPAALNDADIAYVVFVWYRTARAMGGAPDPAMEQMHAEVVAETRYGARAARGSSRMQ